MKQTAVEWLFQELNDYYNLKSTKSKREILEQAKEMEKQQIIDARENGFGSSENWKGDSEQYYNKTFKK